MYAPGSDSPENVSDGFLSTRQRTDPAGGSMLSRSALPAYMALIVEIMRQ
jgi:hypothetical protein